MENLILRRIAELANQPIEFKCERILTGTATIGGMPIDITVKDNAIHLNGVGSWGGSAKQLSKSEWRGKGMFKQLVPHIKQALNEYGLSNEIFLTPLSPVWHKNYNLVYDEIRGWKIIL